MFWMTETKKQLPKAYRVLSAGKGTDYTAIVNGLGMRNIWRN